MPLLRQMTALTPSPEPTAAAPSVYGRIGKFGTLRLCAASVPGGCGSSALDPRSIRKTNQLAQALNASRASSGLQGSGASYSGATAPPSRIPRESWAFAGYGTAEAAFQTVAWALNRGDLQSFLQGLEPNARELAAQRFNGKSESEIRDLLAADLGSGSQLRLDGRRVQNDGSVVFPVDSFQVDNGSAVTKVERTLHFQQTGGEWKLVGLGPETNMFRWK